MFLLVSNRHAGAHPGDHQHGVSIQISVRLGKTFLRISRRGSLYMYLLSFPRFWTLSIELFWFLFWSILNAVTLKTSNSQRYLFTFNSERNPYTILRETTSILLLSCERSKWNSESLTQEMKRNNHRSVSMNLQVKKSAFSGRILSRDHNECVIQYLLSHGNEVQVLWLSLSTSGFASVQV